MNSLAICDRRYAIPARRVAQSWPLKCPPVLAPGILWPNWNHVEFVYIDLHGKVEDPEWLYADGERVLHISDVRSLPPRVVFATTCNLEETEFFDALRKGTLIYGSGKNYGSRSRAIGAPLLALWFRRFYEITKDAEVSLRLSKARVALTAWARGADRDALGFKIAPPL